MNFHPSFKCVMADRSFVEKMNIDDAIKIAPLMEKMNEYKANDFVVCAEDDRTLRVVVTVADPLNAYMDYNLFNLPKEKMAMVSAMKEYNAAHRDLHGEKINYVEQYLFIDVDTPGEMINAMKTAIKSCNDLYKNRPKDRN